MATIKQRVHKYNGSDYDTIHYETEASLVIYGNSNVAAVLDALSSTYAAKTHSHFSATPTSGQVVTADGTAGSIKTTGYTIATSVPSGAKFTDTVYTHPTTAGNKHIPSGGSSGQILRWSADGTAAWGADNNTTYSNFVKSGSTAAAGLVPSPGTTAGTTKYLREDATWAVPPDTDTKVNTTLATTTKAYLLATSTTPTTTATAVTALADTGVYLDTTAGKLTATSFAGNGASLTNLNGSNIASGTVAVARLPAMTTSANGIGRITASNGISTSYSSGNVTVANTAGVYAVKGTQSAATGTWTGNIPVAALYDGLTIAYYLPYAGSGNATLNLTLSGGGTTGNIEVYYTGTTRMTTHYGAGSTIILTYWSAGSISVAGTATSTDRWTHCDYNTNTTYAVFKASGSTAAQGLVPSPGTTAGTTKYLREDATWAVPPDTNTVYTHPTTSGNKHIPSGGSSGQFLKWSADGTAVWAADNNTTYSAFVKSGSTAAAGLVPKPSTTAGTTKYLREDATWVVPPNTTYSNFVKSGSTAAAGLVPSPGTTAGTTKYLREDATWAVPPDTNTVYTHPTTAGNKHIPSGGSSGQFLGWDSAGTAKWVANPNTNTTYTFATGSTNGTISVTPSGGSAQSVAVKGLGTAAYTATTAYLDAGLGFYASSAVATVYYVTTSIAVTTSANVWINGMIEGSRGNTTRPLMVRFMVYWNKSTLSSATYYDPMGGISALSAHLDADNKVYFSFTCATQYSQIRFFTYTGTTATGGSNVATAISTTAPATFSATKAMTKVYEIRTTTSVGSASGWSAGTAASASIASGVLTITNGTKPALTVTSTTVAT